MRRGPWRSPPHQSAGLRARLHRLNVDARRAGARSGQARTRSRSSSSRTQAVPVQEAGIIARTRRTRAKTRQGCPGVCGEARLVVAREPTAERQRHHRRRGGADAAWTLAPARTHGHGQPRVNSRSAASGSSDWSRRRNWAKDGSRLTSSYAGWAVSSRSRNGRSGADRAQTGGPFGCGRGVRLRPARPPAHPRSSRNCRSTAPWISTPRGIRSPRSRCCDSVQRSGWVEPIAVTAVRAKAGA